jgi:hypothetical protein
VRPVSVTVCLAPAKTIDYPQGGGHLWVYLQWALGLRALGCRVIWLDTVDLADPARNPHELLTTLKTRLQPYGLDEAVALVARDGQPLPPALARRALDLDSAAEADLLLNLWHSLPDHVVRRFRRSAFVDTDPGVLQVWMTKGKITVAPHDVYFTVGETAGTPAARFPDCGLPWQFTPPPVFLAEWPAAPATAGGPYTTTAHWWGGTIEFGGESISNEKRAGFLEFASLPARTPVHLELAVCLGRHLEKWRQRLEPLGWTLREAWDVSATPDQYRAYIQQSRGEFSCARPTYVKLVTGWISDRTVCYLASGKPAIVQWTGPSRFLPEAAGLFRVRDVDEAVQALWMAESDYDGHCRLARALAEEHFDARRVVGRVLARALADRVRRPAGAVSAPSDPSGRGER